MCQYLQIAPLAASSGLRGDPTEPCPLERGPPRPSSRSLLPLDINSLRAVGLGSGAISIGPSRPGGSRMRTPLTQPGQNAASEL